MVDRSQDILFRAGLSSELDLSVMDELHDLFPELLVLAESSTRLFSDHTVLREFPGQHPRRKKTDRTGREKRGTRVNLGGS